MKRSALKEQQVETMRLIEYHFKEDECAPNQAKIAQACGIRQGNVVTILAALEKKYYVMLKHGMARGIDVVVWNNEGEKRQLIVTRENRAV